MSQQRPDLQTFDGWAAVSARLRGQTPEAQGALLATLGIDAFWSQSDEYWRAVLIEDVALAQRARPDRYRELCLAAQQQAVPSQPQPAPHAQAPTSTPVAQTGAGGFRQQLMGEVNTQSAPSSPAPLPAGASFVDRLAPKVEVKAPTLGQASTGGVGAESAQGALGATEALKWPIERYAEVTARAEREPHRMELIWAEHGVVGKHLPRVLKRWRKRFEDNPALEAEWRSLVERYSGQGS